MKLANSTKIIPRPQSNHCRLRWSRFDQKENSEWLLSLLADYFTTLFSIEHVSIMAKARTEWKLSRNGKARFVYLQNLLQDEVDKINDFIYDYSHLITIGRSDNVAWHFSGELDFCIAIDHTFKSGVRGARTEISELKHQAKYNKKLELTPKIVRLMLPAFRRIMNVIGEPISVTYLPPVHGSDYYLPELLAKGLYNLYSTSQQDFDIKLVNARLKSRKPQFKDLSFGSKVRKCGKIYSEDNVEFNGDVAYRRVLIIDDLYQSGASMWSFAGCLKSIGASHVAGLVCVKTWGDRDNL